MANLGLSLLIDVTVTLCVMETKLVKDPHIKQ